MKIDVVINFVQEYLPTKRHRIPRKREMVTTVPVELKEIPIEDFPVAFIVHDYQSLYHGPKSDEELRNMCESERENPSGEYEFAIVPEEIRTYGRKLYRARKYSWGAALSDQYCTMDDVIEIIRERGKLVSYYEVDHDYSFKEGQSVVVRDDLEMRKEILHVDGGPIFSGGKVWDEVGEPRYEIITFGLGHNHGGTGLFITKHYNPNISKDRYFSALDYDLAVKTANEIAERRGDTDDVGKFGEKRIEVLMPEMVHCDPRKQHGDGSDFLNTVEAITNGAKDTTEAAILTFAAAMAM